MRLSELRKRTPVAEAYETAFNHSLVNHRSNPVQLRPSGFPTCSILTYLKLKEYDHHKRTAEETSLFSEFFTEVGTTVHSVLQKWVGMSDVIYGDWHCPKCAVVRRMVGHVCPKCRSHMAYGEIEVESGLVKGHVDGILQLPDKRFWVIDYKTATVAKIAKARAVLPIKQNVFQILSYAHILKHDLGLDIAGASLLYVARNNPRVYHESRLPFDREHQALAKKILAGETRKHMAAVRAFRSNNVNLAIDAKPCRSAEHHLDFFGDYHKCPLADVCFKSERALAAKIAVLEKQLR